MDTGLELECPQLPSLKEGTWTRPRDPTHPSWRFSPDPRIPREGEGGCSYLDDFDDDCTKRLRYMDGGRGLSPSWLGTQVKKTRCLLSTSREPERRERRENKVR